jgi:hypothetical protein
MFDPSGQFELQVAPNGRAAADEYLHQGAMWIEGREGSRYVLRFINRSPQRVCVIFSVDGLDTIHGQPAGINSEGYIADANSTLEVPGWKVDGDTAAEFYFNAIGKSYASRSGASTANVGVIGAMVFREAPQYHGFYGGNDTFGFRPQDPRYSLTSGGSTGLDWSEQSQIRLAGAAGLATAGATNQQVSAVASIASNGILRGISVGSAGSAASAVAQSVGTGFGDATQFSTTQAAFTRANPRVPDAVLAIYYNSAKNLQRMGIQLKSRSTRYDNSTAKAFPAYDNGCTPPPDWKP